MLRSRNRMRKRLHSGVRGLGSVAETQRRVRVPATATECCVDGNEATGFCGPCAKCAGHTPLILERGPGLESGERREFELRGAFKCKEPSEMVVEKPGLYGTRWPEGRFLKQR